MKTYTGVIASTTTHTVTIEYNNTTLELHASGAVAAQAAGMIGRKVTFAVDFSERTESLLRVQLCVRSSYGLRAVAEDARSSGVRVAPGALSASLQEGVGT